MSKKINIVSMKIITLIVLVLYSTCVFCQEKYVAIDQQKYRIKEFGQGDITVLFESGMSDSLEVWGTIPDSVTKFARVFLYDRAGIGKSDTARLKRSVPNMVLELRSILKNQDIKPPYILVGHSLGGLITRYFASNYPEEVKGLLLLDPAPESYWNSMSKRELNKYIEGGTKWYETKFPKEYRKEWYQFIPNLEYMKNLNINKQLPVTLVSATAWHWYKYQKDIITGFINSKHIELEGEHYIFKYHPALTVTYIRELTEKDKVKLPKND
jgi:pimeloyl-ACP methyl ester carboxylesterase